MQPLIETDWLGSKPVFYSPERFSHDLNSLVERSKKLEPDPEGLHYYLALGYAAFGRLPFDGIRALKPNSYLTYSQGFELTEREKSDPYDQLSTFEVPEADIPDIVMESVRRWERSLPSTAEIILPLSGGFDSRFLLWALENRERVRAFTYGLSDKPHRSEEVLVAKELARLTGVRWKQISLAGFHQHLQWWNSLFGFATHAHGMYQLEFYRQIAEEVPRGVVLSGIVGDLWAGSVGKLAVERPDDLFKLGLSRGLNGRTLVSNESVALEGRDRFYAANKSRLQDWRFQTVTTVRLKMILLSYLLKVPRHFGMDVWSPFLDANVALAILNLPEKRREGRSWQKDFFRKTNLMPPPFLFGSKQNSLNLRESQRSPLPPLDVDLLSHLVPSSSVETANSKLNVGPTEALLIPLAQSGGAVRRLLRNAGLFKERYTAYGNYVTLYPLQEALKRTAGYR